MWTKYKRSIERNNARKQITIDWQQQQQKKKQHQQIQKRNKKKLKKQKTHTIIQWNKNILEKKRVIKVKKQTEKISINICRIIVLSLSNSCYSFALWRINHLHDHSILNNLNRNYSNLLQKIQFLFCLFLIFFLQFSSIVLFISSKHSIFLL